MREFRILSKYETLKYIKNEFNLGNRIIVSRYADGEYELITGLNVTGSARQILCEELTTLLTNALKNKDN